MKFEALAGFIGVCVVAFVICLFGSWAIIQPEHVGVKKTLGSVSTQYLDPGIHLKMPLITKIIPIKISQNTVASETEVVSSDAQAIQMKYTVMYRINPDQVYNLYTKFSGDNSEGWYKNLVAPKIEEITKQVSAQYRAQEMMQKRLECKTEILKRAKQAVTHMEIVDITVNNIELSPELNKAIEAKMVADQKAQAKDYELKEAQKQAEIIEVEAKAKAQALSITAEALQKNPGVAVIEGIKKWDGQLPATLVLSSSGNTTSSQQQTPIMINAATK